jgi:hypothetical protein
MLAGDRSLLAGASSRHMENILGPGHTAVFSSTCGNPYYISFDLSTAGHDFVVFILIRLFVSSAAQMIASADTAAAIMIERNPLLVYLSYV